jgi:RNA polymerase sigma factor (sigma-70 family)
VTGRDPESRAQDLATLFESVTVAGLTDGQLLDRFAGRDGEPSELAFAALVERHGPMILRACRAILRDEPEAEDAFQATFLALVRRAGAIRVDDSLAPWLYRVACRAAVRARVTSGRRREAERGRPHRASTDPPDDHDDPGPILADELGRLPERHRLPVVLCDLEGRSYEEAARRLGCPVGTLKSRLARARSRLRDRLTRRGLAPAAAMLAAGSLRTAEAAVPPTLAHSTTRAAAALAAGRPTIGIVSATASALSKGVLTTMPSTKALIAASTALVLGLAAAGVLARGPADDPPAPGGAAQAAKAQPAPKPRRGIDRDARTLAIEMALDQEVVLQIPNRTTLVDALKHIKAMTAGPDLPSGIPIYVEPEGREEVGVDLDKPIDLILIPNKVPLRKSLLVLLRPLGLDFEVRDGLLTVTSRDQILAKEIVRLREQLRDVTQRLEALEKRGPGRAAPGPGNQLP